MCNFENIYLVAVTVKFALLVSFDDQDLGVLGYV